MKKSILALVLAVFAAACLPRLPEVYILPSVELPVVAEQEVVWNSADYKGKPILLVFMGSWCPWCKKTMPAVMEAAQKYGDKAEIVAVFVDTDAAPVQAAMKANNFTGKAIYNGSELAESLEVGGFPHSVLFDKKHRAIKHWEGFSPDRFADYEEGLKKVTK
ncbi:MAG: TlpA family protein disulfide reductase [Elusimicrobiaceae bacterium]|nr:TlpA family protein disulfide reductase [Elusimicrobiaceae bacterium]